MAKQKQGDVTVRDAGRKGGEATARAHGQEFYKQIGRKGGEAGGRKGGSRVRELIDKGKRSEQR